MKNCTLLVFGVLLMLSPLAVMRHVHATDLSDFGFGAVYGLGLGLMILFVWKLRSRSDVLL